MIPHPHRYVLALVMILSSVSMACSSDNGGSGGAGDASADSAVEPEAEDADTIPCAPRAVLQTVCQTCHARPPRNGAPFPLVNRSNIVKRASDGRPLSEHMIEQVEARRMPLAPVTIDDGSRAILLDWLRAGAPAVPAQQCSDAGTSEAGADASAGN